MKGEEVDLDMIRPVSKSSQMATPLCIPRYFSSLTIETYMNIVTILCLSGLANRLLTLQGLDMLAFRAESL